MFRILDLKNGFFHVPVGKGSRKRPSFTTHGQHEFLHVLFGMSNSLAVFPIYIFAIFRELIQDWTIITYMNDIVIP